MRFTADVLNGVPSIVIGIVAYALVVLTQKHFSALAGGVALAIMMIPTITRTTEEMLLLVPQRRARSSLRTGRSAAGAPRFRSRCAPRLPGHHRRMLAFARVAGETAPLLFTAFGNQYLELENQPAHGRTAAADFYLCHFAL